MNRCPGSDARNVTAVEVVCPSCGASVELFSDEQRRRCPSCGTKVTRDAVPACAAWCPSAAACIGPEKLESLLRTLREAAEASEDAERSRD